MPAYAAGTCQDALLVQAGEEVPDQVANAGVHEQLGCSLGYGELEAEGRLGERLSRSYHHEPERCNLDESAACLGTQAETHSMVRTWARLEFLTLRWPNGP